jgi:uncharacterized membrane protein YfcA
LGEPNQAVWKLVVASTAIAVIGFFIGAAASARTQQWRVGWLGATCVVLALLTVFTYWQLRRPLTPQPLASFTVDGTEVQELHATGEPGGPEDILPPAPVLTGGATYLFNCYSAVGRGSHKIMWLRLAGYQYWYPMADLHPTIGVRATAIPPC